MCVGGEVLIIVNSANGTSDSWEKKSDIEPAPDFLFERCLAFSLVLVKDSQAPGGAKELLAGKDWRKRSDSGMRVVFKFQFILTAYPA